MKPKFRAWDRIKKRMFLVLEIDYENELVSDETYWNTIPFDDVKIMQFTGLKDRYGEEIYEGDIVRFFECDGDGYTVPVVWDNDYACFSVDWGSNMLSSFDYLYLEEFYTDIKDIEVVGNIYENPGLLGGK
ncbi:hypothetical protein Si129_00803 [Streptococcus infantarius subsp. infantarius]|uniref:YopX family protein n=1 Tax=Streptococcus infantarius TaxID=102684 RepID=UPI00208F0587|nr:YopX family protein [Streptococcus infantarius]MCO4480121.1 hypothetical protein [Streptococcus infantarius subsp. infantarius]MCO4506377.1 hypothetical protein [Streptococcus infantarius subsp. infantarius]MCY7237914.1 YopX family protein [Streptococcus infantarius]